MHLFVLKQKYLRHSFECLFFLELDLGKSPCNAEVSPCGNRRDAGDAIPYGIFDCNIKGSAKWLSLFLVVIGCWAVAGVSHYSVY